MVGADTKTILMMGKTGCGKGTQAALLAKKLGFTVFSSGDAFREIREHQTVLGKRVREEYDKGVWLPHWFASYLFEDALFHLPDGAGIIFEGVGRTKEEAVQFDAVALWLSRPYLIFELDISDDESRKRQELRHRDVLDTPEKIETRLEQYREFTVPAIEFFREKGAVITIPGEGTIESIHEAIMKNLPDFC